MPTVKVVDVLDRVSIILQDVSNVRFPLLELQKFFNDAQREICLQRPDANSVNETFSCANGSKQELTSDDLRLIEVIRNVNGRAVTQISRKILDDSLPDWHSSTAGANKIEHFVYEPADPKLFYVYPQAEAGVHSLEVVVSKVPADSAVSTEGGFSSDTTTIGVDDLYANAILDYILYRAYQKDSEYAGNPERSALHFQSFSNSLGMKARTDTAIDPRPNNQRVQQ